MGGLTGDDIIATCGTCGYDVIICTMSHHIAPIAQIRLRYP